MRFKRKSLMTMRKNESEIRQLIKCIGSKGKVPFWTLFCVIPQKMNHLQLDECQKEKKAVISIIYYLYDLICWKIFYIWFKSILGNHEITLYCYFLSSDIEKEKREAIEAQIVL